MKTSKGYFSATRIAVIALFSSISGILYIFGFPIAAAFPSWLELNFSDIPALIGTFTLGPLSGAIIVFIKILIKFLFKSSSTLFVGELADLLIGCAFVVPAGIIYKRKRTLQGALIGMAVGSLCSVACSILANWLILIPFYLELFFLGSWDPLVGTMQLLFSSCTKENFYTFYLWCSVLPFNVMRCLIAILVTLPVYKHISRAINKFGAKLQPENANENTVKKVNIGALIAFIFAIALIITFALLRYFLWS